MIDINIDHVIGKNVREDVLPIVRDIFNRCGLKKEANIKIVNEWCYYRPATFSSLKHFHMLLWDNQKYDITKVENCDLGILISLPKTEIYCNSEDVETIKHLMWDVHWALYKTGQRDLESFRSWG